MTEPKKPSRPRKTSGGKRPPAKPRRRAPTRGAGARAPISRVSGLATIVKERARAWIRRPATLSGAVVIGVLALGVGFGLWFPSSKPPAPEGRRTTEARPAVSAPVVPAAPPAPAAVPAQVTSEPEPADAEAMREDPVPTAPPASTPDALVAILPPPAAPRPPSPPPPAPPGTPQWRTNAVPFTAPAGKPLIAIVVDDMGLDRPRTDRVVRLKAPLTLAWLPYAVDLPARTRAARAAGHELLVHMPMEPGVKADPGPGALRVSLSLPEMERTLTTALAAFDGYVGLNNHMGSRFTERTESMRPVIAELRRRGLLWLDSRTTPKSVGSSLAIEMSVPKADRDIFLDNVQSVSAVREELVKLEEIARTRGKAIAIGHPHDTTIEALSAWLPTLQAKGFVQAPISAMVTTKATGR